MLMRSRSAATWVALAVTCGLGLTACSHEPDDSRPLVVASFGPLAWATEQVAGDDFRVENLAAPGVEAHDLDPSVRQMADIERAEVVVLLDGFQAAVDTAAKNVAEGRILDVTRAARLLPSDEHGTSGGHEGHDHAEGEHGEHGEHGEGHEDGAGAFGAEHAGHDHGDTDPHFWQDPLRMADVVDAIATELGKARPDDAAVYAARAAEVRAELTGLDGEFRTGLASCARDTVVVSHEAFGYLSTYGLHFEAINGLSPGAEPTPAELARLQRLIKDEGITTVFSEAGTTKKLAETLAADTGVTTAVLNPLESVPGGAEGDYLTIMRDNLTALKKANACH